MESYANRSGRSGVSAFEAGRGFIRVVFADGRAYLYTEESAGRVHVAAMKRLAAAGEGLCAYISKYVREAYAAREP